MAAILFDRALQVRQRPADADVVIDQDVLGARLNHALERRRRHEAIERRRPGVADRVALHDLADAHREVELAGQHLGHRIRNSVEARRFFSRDRQEDGGPSRSMACKASAPASESRSTARVRAASASPAFAARYSGWWSRKAVCVCTTTAGKPAGQGVRGGRRSAGAATGMQIAHTGAPRRARGRRQA